MSEPNDAVAKMSGDIEVFHRSGLLVKLAIYGFTAEEMYAAIDGALAAGFSVSPPGKTADGELSKDVGWVVRTTMEGRSGQSDVLHLYSADEVWTMPFLVKYLNTAPDRTEFEAASGMRLANIPEYVGEGRLERGKNPKTDSLIIKAPKPFQVIYTGNPKYDQSTADAMKAENKVYKIPKKVFVRWGHVPVQQPEQAEAQPAAQPVKATPAANQAVDVGAKWADWIAKGPRLSTVNDAIRNLAANSVAWPLLNQYAETKCWVFDSLTNGYTERF